MRLARRGYVTLNLSETKVLDVYRLMTSCIVPRPIAFVSTLNEDGTVNLAPYSFFMGVSSNPPVLAFASTTPGKRSGKRVKDSLANIRRTGQFVVNSAQEAFGSDVNACSTELPAGESELELTNLSLRPSEVVAVPSVAQADWNFECELYNEVQVGEADAIGAAALVLGRIVSATVSDAVYLQNNPDGLVDMGKLGPLARLSGPLYAGLREPFRMARPKRD